MWVVESGRKAGSRKGGCVYGRTGSPRGSFFLFIVLPSNPTSAWITHLRSSRPRPQLSSFPPTHQHQHGSLTHVSSHHNDDHTHHRAAPASCWGLRRCTTPPRSWRRFGSTASVVVRAGCLHEGESRAWGKELQFQVCTRRMNQDQRKKKKDATESTPSITSIYWPDLYSFSLRVLFLFVCGSTAFLH